MKEGPIINWEMKPPRECFKVLWDACIENIFINNEIGYITISNGDVGESSCKNDEHTTLIINKNTIIRDKDNQEFSLFELSEGMSVDAEFSATLTKNIPPQAKAFRITVIDKNNDSSLTKGEVLCIDHDNGLLYVGDENNTNSQTVFVIKESTVIRNKEGQLIGLGSIRLGQLVVVEHLEDNTSRFTSSRTAINVQTI
jgi:hypothetical protein